MGNRNPVTRPRSEILSYFAQRTQEQIVAWMVRHGLPPGVNCQTQRTPERDNQFNNSITVILVNANTTRSVKGTIGSGSSLGQIDESMRILCRGIVSA